MSQSMKIFMKQYIALVLEIYGSHLQKVKSILKNGL